MSHNELNGWYYSFGNVSIFEKVNNSLVGQYIIKKSPNDDKQDKIEEAEILIDNMISVELIIALDTLSTILPNVKMLIAHVLDVVHDLQDEYGKIGIKPTPIGRGIWSTCLCVNATTGLFHNEDDYMYTIISVPLQLKSVNMYKFLFQLNDRNIIGVEMNPNLSLFSQEHY